MNKDKKNQKGMILLLTLFILSSILVVTLAAADLVMAGIRMNRLVGYSSLAFFAAEAGMERSLWEARTWEARGEANPLPDMASVQNLFFGSLSNGSSYTVDYASSTPNVTFKSIGSFGGVKRSVESTFEIR